LDGSWCCSRDGNVAVDALVLDPKTLVAHLQSSFDDMLKHVRRDPVLLSVPFQDWKKQQEK
jgi:hypothetical protein